MGTFATWKVNLYGLQTLCVIKDQIIVSFVRSFILRSFLGRETREYLTQTIFGCGSKEKAKESGVSDDGDDDGDDGGPKFGLQTRVPLLRFLW